MSVVQLMSNELWSYYERAKESSFSIGPGKMFMDDLGKFLACVRGNDRRYESGASRSEICRPGPL